VIVYVVVALDATRDEDARVVAPHVCVDVLKLLVEQTNNLTVSATPVMSASEEVEKNVTLSPGRVGELL
jgi:hypothetical protein